MMTNELLLRNVRPMAKSTVDILIRGGKIVDIGPTLNVDHWDHCEVIDGNNAIALPGLVEAHTHLDKSLLGLPWYRNEVGPRLIDKIENERQVKHQLGIEPQRQSERQSILSVSKGSTHIRSHVDVDTQDGLKGVVGVATTREKLRELIDIEIVVFPQSGLLIRPGTVELMDEALSNGADVVGGIDPAGMDRDPKGHIDTVFKLAEKHGKPVDIHLHEAGELGGFSMELIIERTKALSMQGKVTISHAFCLGMDNQHYVAQLIEQLVHTQIHIMTTGPASRPAPPVKALRAAGVIVCSGSDGIRDTWGPYGNTDMLERAMFIGLRNNFRRDDEVEQALDVCTQGGAQVMALPDYGLDMGCQADVVLIEAETLAEAVAVHPTRKLVLKRGKIVARDGVCIRAMP